MILDLGDGVANTSFLNGLKSDRFKFSLAEQKETTLTEALRKAADFIRAPRSVLKARIVPRKLRSLKIGDGGGDGRPRLEVVDPRFTTDPRTILMEVRDHPMLKRPPLMTSTPKPHNARKYCEFNKQNGHMTAECQELRKALHELANKG